MSFHVLPLSIELVRIVEAEFATTPPLTIIFLEFSWTLHQPRNGHAIWKSQRPFFLYPHLEELANQTYPTFLPVTSLEIMIERVASIWMVLLNALINFASTRGDEMAQI